MKRFYKTVTTARGDDGWDIHLDGRPVKTASGRVLRAPSEHIAAGIVAEWAAQVTKINPETMPLTQILSTAIDHVQHHRPVIAKNMLGYLDTDLLLYRAVMPEILAERQRIAWDPWVLWFAGRSGVTLKTTTALHALQQDRAAHDYATRTVDAMDLWTFNATQIVTSISGSVILALAFVAGDAAGDDVFSAAQVEELYKGELYNEALYGADPNIEKAQASLRRDLGAVRLFLDGIR